MSGAQLSILDTSSNLKSGGVYRSTANNSKIGKGIKYVKSSLKADDNKTLSSIYADDSPTKRL